MSEDRDTDRDEAAVAGPLYTLLNLHAEHPWRQVGRCVYCSCGDRVRLYQGTIPEGHPVAPNPPRSAKNDPATAMLSKWGKV